jgi:hypothetical protein
MYFLVFVIASLWPQCHSNYSKTLKVLVVQPKESLHRENSGLSRYVQFENITDSVRFNFTVVEGGEGKYEELLNKFCMIEKSSGIFAIISEVRSSQLLDVYASYLGIPMIKFFHNEQQLVKQVRSYVSRFVKKAKARGNICLQLQNNSFCSVSVVSYG